jgi:hypothetical protein
MDSFTGSLSQLQIFYGKAPLEISWGKVLRIVTGLRYLETRLLTPLSVIGLALQLQLREKVTICTKGTLARKSHLRDQTTPVGMRNLFRITR